MKNLIKLLILAGIICSLMISNCTSVQEPWTDLITENGIEDFIQLGGKAIYSIEDGTITGTTVAHTENSFLCTPKQYGDFILEFKVLVDTALNSGVQIRSHAFQNGRVYGYQVEIDPSARAYSGGIYDEARRGWLPCVAPELLREHDRVEGVPKRQRLQLQTLGGQVAVAE